MKATLFPFSNYKQIFHPAEWLADQAAGEDEPPEAKKPKTEKKKVADFWRVANEELSDPDFCVEFIDMLHQAYASTISRQRQSVPFMDIVEVCGVTFKPMESITSGQCRLLCKFIEILATSQAFLIGQYNTRSAKIITNGIRAASGHLEVDDLEKVLEKVLELDPGLLAMVMDVLWQHWTKNNLISIMIKLGNYLGKKNVPSSIMKDLYNQGRALTKQNKDFDAEILAPGFVSLLGSFSN